MKTASASMRTLVLSGNPHNSNLATRARARSAPFLRRAFPNLLQLLQAGDQARSCSCCGPGAELQEFGSWWKEHYLCQNSCWCWWHSDLQPSRAWKGLQEFEESRDAEWIPNQTSCFQLRAAHGWVPSACSWGFLWIRWEPWWSSQTWNCYWDEWSLVMRFIPLVLDSFGPVQKECFMDTRLELCLFSSFQGELYHVPDVRPRCCLLVSAVSQSSAGRSSCASRHR